MSNLIPIHVPDIGDANDVDVIELLVSAGDNVAKDDALVTLETDKATMDVPSELAGVVKKIHVAVGDKVSQGSLIVELEAEDDKSGSESEQKNTQQANQSEQDSKAAQTVNQTENTLETEVQEKEVQEKEVQEKDLLVPDIGDAADVDVIEVLFEVGDKIEKDQSLVVLETDKATMEVPASDAGEITELLVKVGDKVSFGDKLGKISSKFEYDSKQPSSQQEKNNSNGDKDSLNQVVQPMPQEESADNKSAPVPEHPQMKKRASSKVVYASPSVRRFARELGADLTQVVGTGNKGRIQKQDVQNFIKAELSTPKSTASSASITNMLPMPEIDHAKWGDVETKALSRIQKISSANLHRNWVSIPHVTQHEDADITELDAFRKSLKEEAIKDGVRLTPLAFIMKGLVYTLKAFPKFNASLANDGENLILKNYYHIGVAVETPDGLTVPVIRNVEQKGIYQLATELAEISAKAREKKLSADDMQGSSFTISSLGGIGGTAFSPIVKWPDVAILGLSRNKMQPVWNGNDFVPRLMLPMSLSYDHRVIDGADAARFVVHLAQTLKDIRRVLLK